MAGTNVVGLRIWEGGAVEHDGDERGGAPAAPAEVREAADRLYAREAFRSPARGPAPEPFSPEWFAGIERQRYARKGHWIPRVLEFSRHPGETVLGLGEGLGTDWVQYARHGAEVVAASPSQEQLGLVRRNFERAGLSARLLHAPPHCLPLATSSVDVVCLDGLLHELERPGEVLDEVYRVLRPGGKVIAVAPAKYGSAFWKDALFPWRRWFRRRPMPAYVGATARSLRRDFARFDEHKVSKRHLRRADLPHLWRWMPLPVLERMIGQALVLKTFKPVSAALAVAAAA
jgi:SAM-dependent methyltransferase